jgi:hypothetical protein
MPNDFIEQQRRVQIAEQALAFLQSPVGKHLVARAESEERAALEALANVDPHDPVTIKRLQNEVYRANSIVGWLQEVIAEGLAAQTYMGERETLPESSVREGGEG